MPQVTSATVGWVRCITNMPTVPWSCLTWPGLRLSSPPWAGSAMWQVWPLAYFIFACFFVKKTNLLGKHINDLLFVEDCIFLFHSFKQHCLRPLKGFLGCHSALQGLLCLICCFRNLWILLSRVELGAERSKKTVKASNANFDMCL